MDGGTTTGDNAVSEYPPPLASESIHIDESPGSGHGVCIPDHSTPQAAGKT
ncbi:hypothetical protein ES703_117155 [subsurface metagenome]